MLRAGQCGNTGQTAQGNLQPLPETAVPGFAGAACRTIGDPDPCCLPLSLNCSSCLPCSGRKMEAEMSKTVLSVKRQAELNTYENVLEASLLRVEEEKRSEKETIPLSLGD